MRVDLFDQGGVTVLGELERVDPNTNIAAPSWRTAKLMMLRENQEMSGEELISPINQVRFGLTKPAGDRITGLFQRCSQCW